MAIDPICKMVIDEKKAKFKGVYDGTVYYFCSKECKNDFDEQYGKYKKLLNINITSNIF